VLANGLRLPRPLIADTTEKLVDATRIGAAE
jgi:hypothetical protein